MVKKKFTVLSLLVKPFQVSIPMAVNSQMPKVLIAFHHKLSLWLPPLFTKIPFSFQLGQRTATMSGMSGKCVLAMNSRDLIHTIHFFNWCLNYLSEHCTLYFMVLSIRSNNENHLIFNEFRCQICSKSSITSPVYGLSDDVCMN